MKQVQLPVIISGLATKVDGSIKIALETREMSPQDSAILFDLRGTEAWAVLASEELKEVKLPDERPDQTIGKKTSAQRLRAVLYRVWQQRGGNGVDFESWYRVTMERIIDQYKEKLE